MKGRVKEFLIREGYCEEHLTPQCVQDAIDDLYDQFENKCESPDQNAECQRMFDLLTSLDRTKVFLEEASQKELKGYIELLPVGTITGKHPRRN